MKKALNIFVLINLLFLIKEVPDMIIMHDLLLELVGACFWGFRHLDAFCKELA